MNPLKDLNDKISAVNRGITSEMVFGQESIHKMKAEVGRLQIWLNSMSNAKPDDRLILESMRAFRKTLNLKNARETRFVCWGASVPLGPDNYLLIEDDGMFQRLLTSVDSYVQEVKVFRRCYRGLLAAYFGYDPEGGANEKGRNNWELLKYYLQKRLDSLGRPGISTPDWISAIKEHSNLLSDNPCERYGRGFLTGEQAEIDLSASIWVSRSIFNARFSAATSCGNDEFSRYVPVLMKMLMDKRYIRFLDKGLTLLLNRCASSDKMLTHKELMAFSIKHWNTPWSRANRLNWELVSKDAARMVEDWLRLDLLGRFFEYFSGDGFNTARRSDFWRRYSDRISDMYFALGRDAMGDRRPEFLEMKKKMDGRLIAIDDGLSILHNNALLMRIGDYWFVEFGGTGGSVFVYENLPFDVSSTLNINISMIKDRNSARDRLHHKDNYHGFSKWEDQFEFHLENIFSLKRK